MFTKLNEKRMHGGRRGIKIVATVVASCHGRYGRSAAHKFIEVCSRIIVYSSTGGKELPCVLSILQRFGACASGSVGAFRPNQCASGQKWRRLGSCFKGSVACAPRAKHWEYVQIL